MKTILPFQLEMDRITHGPMASTSDYGANGAFLVDGPNSVILRIIASDGDAWEHVSVSTEHRTPNWDEMCFVKNLFWSEDECVIQYHPSRENYVNYHPYTLHMWKPIGVSIPTPPTIMIGPKT